MEAEVTTGHGLNLIFIIWGALTTLTSLLGIVVGYFLKGWKKGVDDKLIELDKKNVAILGEEAKCKIDIATNFIRHKDLDQVKSTMEDTFAKIYLKIDTLCRQMSEQHAQVMYQLGLKNGINSQKGD